MRKDLVILAVTKMHGGVCTAGIDAEGSWVRSVRPTTKRIDECDTVTDYCLLPLVSFTAASHIWSTAVYAVFGSRPTFQHDLTSKIGRAIFGRSLNCYESSVSPSRSNFSLATVKPTFPRSSPMKIAHGDYSFLTRSASALP
jgi:hypothetical protein